MLLQLLLSCKNFNPLFARTFKLLIWFLGLIRLYKLIDSMSRRILVDNKTLYSQSDINKLIMSVRNDMLTAEKKRAKEYRVYEFNKLIKFDKFREYICAKFNMSLEKDIKFWDAFVRARSIMYPSTKKSTDVLSLREAEKLLDGFISKTTIMNKVKSGVIESIEGKPLGRDIRLIASLLDYDLKSRDAGFIEEGQDREGRQVIGVYFLKNSIKGQSVADQKLKALAKMHFTPEIQAWFKAYADLDKEDTKE